MGKKDKKYMGLRDLSANPFKPQVVSIGPLHREHENLQAYEKRKATFVNELWDLDDSGWPSGPIGVCVQKMVSSIDRIRACYDNIKIEEYNDNQLAKMMVVDASFILGFILTILKDQKVRFLKPDPIAHPSTRNIKKSFWRRNSVLHDLVLVENQIPFFVLEEIFDHTILKIHPTASLPDYILVLVQIFNVFETNITKGDFYPIVPHDHLLGFLEKCYWPSKKSSPSQGLVPTSGIHSTVELHRKGLKIKPNRDEKWQMAMEFKSSRWYLGKPVLRMPVLRIDKFTALVLKNLIAYEQTSGFGDYVTSYAMAMDMLVNTEDDIARLIKSKVVVNNLRSNEWAAFMINDLCKELGVQKFFYVDLWKQLDTHYNRYQPKSISS